MNDISAASHGGHEAARHCEVCWEQTQPFLGIGQGQQMTHCLAVAWITACCMHNVSPLQQLLHHVSCKHQEDTTYSVLFPGACLGHVQHAVPPLQQLPSSTEEITCSWSSIPLTCNISCRSRDADTRARLLRDLSCEGTLLLLQPILLHRADAATIWVAWGVLATDCYAHGAFQAASGRLGQGRAYSEAASKTAGPGSD